ncbi:MAG TPA: protein kinase, partial [Anaerolineaceae bacterium]|nr:protein kinase [Anaerolineaceae bacterium]
LHTRTPPVIHRDIKPGNIKITPEADVVLVDFGLAKVMHQGQATTTGARAMTPGYSPPEQYGTARTDVRSDIYSLGATLYAALTGVIPEDSLSRVTGKAQLTPIRTLRPKVSRKVAQIVETALEADPDDRYQTAEEMKQALIEAGNIAHLFQKSNTVTPPPPGADEPSIEKRLASLDELDDSVSPARASSRPRRRRKAWHPAYYLVMFAGLLGMVWLVGSSLIRSLQPATPISQVAGNLSPTLPPVDPPQPTQTPATSDAPVAAIPVATDTPPSENTLTPPQPSPTPLGGGYSEIAFSSNRTGNYQIWIMNADGTHQRQLTNLPDGACQPAWSPDGIKLSFISPCGGRKDLYPGASIYTMDADGSNITRLPVPPSPAGDFDPAWSPDGKRLAFTSLRNIHSHIFIYEFETNLMVELSDTVFPNKQPTWSPTGLQLAYISEQPNGQVWLMGDTGQLQAQFSPSGGINNLWPAWSPDGSLILYSQSTVDKFNPWLVAMRYEDRNTSRENRIPAGEDTNAGPIADVSISSDGLWLAYESWPFGQNHDIYLMTITGSSQTRLTTDRAWDFGPAWRPSQTTR